MIERLGARAAQLVPVPTAFDRRGSEEILGPGTGVVVDVKTTGLDPVEDTVIELSARCFTYDADHVVVDVEPLHLWRQASAYPLPREVMMQLDLTDEDLEGATIDRKRAVEIIRAADICISHSARFDRPLVEDLLPGARGLKWACAIEDIGWLSRGHKSCSLADITNRCGLRYDTGRCGADIDAVISLLRHDLEPGRSGLAVLLEHAAKESWIVRAFNAPPQRQHLLHARGFHWDPLQGVWWKNTYDKEPEERWLAAQIYSATSLPLPAVFERRDWTSRYV